MAVGAGALSALGPDVRDEFDDVPDGVHVVAPSDVTGVTRVLRTASENGLRVLIWGGGSHQGIGHPVEPDVVLVTTRLDAVVDWQPEDLTLVVEGGMTVTRVEDMLAERGQTAVLPETAAAGGVATVGGVIAAGMSGWRRLAYGPTRDRMLEVTLATGDGRLATAGGRVVKNVSGYDIPRLVTGSLGSLGVITQVCLKLWPVSNHAATITVDDASVAFRTAYRPLAVLETERRSTVMVAGTAEEIAGQAADLDGAAVEGLVWPDLPETPHLLSLRVIPPAVGDAVERVRGLGAGVRFVAAHGVGEIHIGLDTLDADAADSVRSWAEALGGALVVLRAPEDSLLDPWGTPPMTVDLQRRVKDAFDPAGICNPGRLPGRI